jgi:hypothetical protein
MRACSTSDSEYTRLLADLHRLLAGRGYRRRGTIWYSDTRDLIRVFGFDPGQGPLAWTQFGLGVHLHALDKVHDPTVWDMIRPVRSRATHPQIEDCAVSLGLHDLLTHHSEFDGLQNLPDQNVFGLRTAPQVVQIASKTALPWLESFRTVDDVRRLVHSECQSFVRIREPAKAILFGI